MTKSDSIKELASALAKAQSKINKAVKDTLNPHFKSKFANLESVVDASREALSENGLSVAQLVGTSLEKSTTLTTILMHSSGEYLCDTVNLPVTKPGPQEVGSCLTYMKRYCLASIVGVADTDDDAETAMGREKPVVENKAAQPVSTNKIVYGKVGQALSTDSKYSDEPGSYVIPFGIHLNKKLSELSTTDLNKSIQWARNAKDPKDSVKAFLKEAESFAEYLYNSRGDLVTKFDPTDSLPF